MTDMTFALADHLAHADERMHAALSSLAAAGADLAISTHYQELDPAEKVQLHLAGQEVLRICHAVTALLARPELYRFFHDAVEVRALAEQEVYAGEEPPF